MPLKPNIFILEGAKYAFELSQLNGILEDPVGFRAVAFVAWISGLSEWALPSGTTLPLMYIPVPP